MNMKAGNIQIIVLQIVYKISNFNTKITVTFEEKRVNRMEIYFQMYFSCMKIRIGISGLKLDIFSKIYLIEVYCLQHIFSMYFKYIFGIFLLYGCILFLSCFMEKVFI